MVTFIFLLLWVSLTLLGTLLISSAWYFIILWVLLAIPLSGVVFIFGLVLLMPIMKRTKPDSYFKYKLIQGLARFCNLVAFNMKIEVVGKENIPKTGRLTIYANHKSMLDPFVVMATINRSLAFTPKISIYKVPILSHYMHYIGCLPIDRNDNRRTAKTMVQAIKNVEKGHAMLLFPEGGIIDRTTEKMIDVKGGAYKIGVKSESDFLPMSIIGTSNIQDMKWYQRKKVKLVIHPLVKFDEVKELNTTQLGEKMLETINSVLT